MAEKISDLVSSEFSSDGLMSNTTKKLSKVKTEIIGVASLFTSLSTLICCALPLLLVTLGLGAVVAGGHSRIADPHYNKPV